MDISNVHFMHSEKIYMKNIPVDDGYIFFKLNNPGNSSASCKKLFYFKIKNSIPETDDTYNKTLILSDKSEFIAHSHTFFYNRIDRDNIVIYIPDNYDAMSISTIQSGKIINNLINIVSIYSNLELEYSNIDYISSIKCFKENIHYEDLRIEQLRIIDNEYHIQNLELVDENSSVTITINGQFTFLESLSNSNFSGEIIFPLELKKNEYKYLSVIFNTELKVFPGTIIEDIEFIHSGIPSSCTVSVSKCTKNGFNFTIINGGDQNIFINTISWYLKSKIKSNIINKLTLGKNDINVSKISKKNNSIEIIFDGLILSNLIDVVVDNSIKMELEYYKFLGFKTIAKWKTIENILNKNVILFNIKDVYNNEFKHHNGVNRYFIT